METTNQDSLSEIRENIRELKKKEKEYFSLARKEYDNRRREIYIKKAHRYRDEIDILIIRRNEILSSDIPSITTLYQNSISNIIQLPKSISDNIPNEYICPITCDIMTEPVILTDGHTYEKKAITKWLETHNTSPLTKEIVNKEIIIPCYSLRSLIQDFIEKNKKL